MPEQERIQHARPSEHSTAYTYEAKDAVREQEEARRTQNRTRKEGRTIIDLSDELMAEIDEILDEVKGEQTEQEWVNSYRQKGGQ